jgi:hypothetical protein
VTRAFSTSVEEISGIWPEAPSTWSYSSLAAAERCPRRWSLSRATYGGNDRPGYPDLPNVAALIGRTVHNAVEIIVDAVAQAGCASVSDPLAVTVVKELGGLSSVITDSASRVLAEVQKNPRASRLMPYLEKRFKESKGEMRLRTQQLLVQTGDLTRQEKTSSVNSKNSGRTPLRFGPHPEQRLDAEALQLMGIVDLLLIESRGATIVDYKTGAAKYEHREQLMTYAVLWNDDSDRNSHGLPVFELRVVYPTAVECSSPKPADVLDFREVLRARLSAAKASVSAEFPQAKPEPESCLSCHVRHLCDEYWELPLDTLVSESSMVSDISVSVISIEGPNLYRVAFDDRLALLEVKSELSPGARLRVLAVRLPEEDDSELDVLQQTVYTEVFVLVRNQSA